MCEVYCNASNPSQIIKSISFASRKLRCMKELKKDKDLSERLEDLIKKKSDESEALKRLLEELSKKNLNSSDKTEK